MTVDVHTTRLLEQLRVAVHADRRRRRLGATLAVALMAGSGGARAAATQAPWWLAQLPGTSASAGTLPGRFTLVGLDGAGREVVMVSLNGLEDKARPR